MRVRANELRGRALGMIRVAQKVSGQAQPELDFIALAIQGKKIGFEAVIKMIDDMVVTLKNEQVADDNKKEQCNADVDKAEDKLKGLKNTLSDTKVFIADAKDGIKTLEGEIAALKASIKALDDSVAKATAQREAEHEEFTQLMASDSAAKELLNFAKNRLNKFYNPGLYKAPPKEELSRQARIAENLGASLAQGKKEAPPPPPETFGAYTKKSGDNAGVVEMIDLLIKDLDKDMTEAKTSEELAQKDYDSLMADSKAKRAQDAAALNEKESTKAEMESDLDGHEEKAKSTTSELMATTKHLQALHGECDWLLQNFEARKHARSNEIDALGKAKDVLSGADYE
eukprot:NODE_1001_length_1273_cov_258.847291.p1 GENE.NODE_1001_length_1273_cov_258.847291~~NODE_1001_length_1273_cov_258.847291.p1  ORF type:complete len:343 (-),score=182.93 NODE_1001_length_1273_cov_258.847291:146-1174(-)